MNRTALASCIAVAVALASACGNDMPFDPDDPRLENARLVIVGSPAINLRYGDVASLRVRYEAEDGTVIENAPIDYAIVGEAAGSRLAAFQTVTDPAGEAAIDLTAGNADGMFSVTATAPGGDVEEGPSVTFSVAVSDEEAGSIVVSMTYAGERELVRFDAYLFEGADCASLDPLALPTALRMAPSASVVTAMPAFAGVPVGSDYTVAVRASNTAAVAAFGCRDGIAVVNGEETPVNITLMDTEIAPNFVGVWDLDNRFDFGGALPESVETVVDILTEIGDDYHVDSDGDPDGSADPTDADGDGRGEYGVDPGAFVADLAMRQTCAWDCSSLPDSSDRYDLCSDLPVEVSNHPLGDLRIFYQQNFSSWDGAEPRGGTFGLCGAWTFIMPQVQDLVNETLLGELPDFIPDWLNLVSDLASAITNAHILSVLTINAPAAGSEFDLPMSHELVQMVVEFRNPSSDPPGATESRTFALADAGFESLLVEDMTTVDGTTLSIPEHSFTLNWGELVLYIYRNVLLNEIFGVTSTGDLLAEWIDCAQVAVWVKDALDGIPGAGSITEATLEGYCNTALAAAGGLLESQLADLLDIDGTLTISGTATGEDIDESTGRVDTLVDGMWSGSFSDMASTGDVTGIFMGARRTGG